MGLLRGVARTAVVAGTASTVAGRVQHRQQRKWDQQAAEQAPPPPAPAAPAPAPAPAPAAAPSGGGDLVAQLQQLEQLRQQGAITEEEFSAAKARLIGG